MIKFVEKGHRPLTQTIQVNLKLVTLTKKVQYNVENDTLYGLLTNSFGIYVYQPRNL